MSLRELDRHGDRDGSSSGVRRRTARPWWVSYRRKVAVSDVLAVVTAMVLANVVRFDGSTTATVVGLDWLTYPAISALIGLSWVFALVVSRAYSVHRLGFGEEEYRAVGTPLSSSSGACPWSRCSSGWTWPAAS